jgi:hypothetical protein
VEAEFGGGSERAERWIVGDLFDGVRLVCFFFSAVFF